MTNTASIEIRTSQVALDQRHAYILFTKENGDQYVLRAGPSKGTSSTAILPAASGGSGLSLYGQIYVTAEAYKINGQPANTTYYNVQGIGWIPEDKYVPGKMVLTPDPEGLSKRIVPPADWPTSTEPAHEQRTVVV
jgi:hypothetical protein